MLPANDTALFPTRHDRDRIDAALTEALADAGERMAQGPVTPRLDLPGFRRELAAFDFSAPQPLADALGWIVAQMEHGLVHVNHPRYFGLFNPAPSFPAQCGDRVVAAFNPQLASATTSPVAVELEAHVIRAVARRAGLSDGAGGHFTTSGSEANLTGLLCALTAAHPGFAAEGARAFPGAPVFYVSQDCHNAWIKIAHQAGIGRGAVRYVATDGSGRMSAEQLARRIEQDRADGKVPVMIVATAGTTVAGMIDPLVPCLDLARDHGIWGHVDAAWGGAVIASDRFRGDLAGLERADSVTIDAHKWFATTMGCGMFLLRRPEQLGPVFQLSADFMPSAGTVVADPYVTTVQWSRRFLGLRLFLALAAAGWAGYADHVEHAIEVIELVRAQLARRGWQIRNHSHMAVLCAAPPPGSRAVRDIVQDLVAAGEAWVAPATFEGEPVVRICCTHGQTSAADVDRLVAALDRLAQADQQAADLKTADQK